MALVQSYVGTTSIGSLAQTPATNTAYAKKVTIPANSVLSAVEAHVALTDGDSIGFRVAVWADNAGALATLMAVSPQPPTNAIRIGGTDRWFGESVGLWFGSSTDVWIGVHIFDPAGTTLSFETTGGTDVTVASGGVWTGETGATGVTVTVTDNDYSIRGVVLT